MSNFKELILHDEKNFTIINKPAGIQTERDRLGNPSIEAMFEDHLLSISRINARPYIVHRLDRPVSGILILAKSKTALLHFQEQIQEGIFHKKYYTRTRYYGRNTNSNTSCKGFSRFTVGT